MNPRDTVIRGSWSRSCGLTVSAGLAALAFPVFTIDRWFVYGFRDPRTFMPFAIAIVQLAQIPLVLVETWLYRY